MSKKQLITTHYLNYNTAKQYGDDGYDKIILVIKDENGVKRQKLVDKPKFSYYMTKPEYYEKGIYYNYIEKEKVNRMTCEYKSLATDMMNLGRAANKKYNYDFINYNKNSGESFRIYVQNLNYMTYFHSSDMNIQDFYIHTFLNNFNPEENFVSLTKAFFDIEVDSSELKGFPDPKQAEAPVNIITLINQETMECYVLMLKYNHQGYIDTVKNLDSIEKRLKEKYKSKIILNNIKYIFEQFDTELDLIKRFFYLINEVLRPDICVAWNISFDFVTLYERLLKLLGEDMNDEYYHPKLDNILCPKDFKYKHASYYIDENHSDPAERSDNYKVTSYTTYIDLMCLYANITKPMGKKESYSLDFIAEEETGIKKDEYEGSIKTLHFDDYETFLFYNINDSILLFLIEDKTKHLDLLYNISMLTHTRIEKSLKKTVCLRNYAAQFYEKNGYVMGNNHSALYERPDSKIKGAFVADPNNMVNNGKMMDFGKSNKIYDLATDMDFAALYPSIIEVMNVAPDAIDLKLFFYIKDKDTNEYIEKTDEFMDDLLSQDSINFCHKYYKLPSISEMFNLIEDNLVKND